MGGGQHDTGGSGKRQLFLFSAIISNGSVADSFLPPAFATQFATADKDFMALTTSALRNGVTAVSILDVARSRVTS